MSKYKYTHWKLEKDDDGIAWLYMDVKDASTNVLSEHVIKELETIISLIQNDMPRGIVISSAKKNGFIAGADINEFTTFDTEKDALEKVQRAHRIFSQIESLTCPSVALIHGFCLGGGMELALACQYRVADDASARLGLPEVKLGIHPGFGGTVRAFEKMGTFAAMDIILTGRTVSARQAKKSGLIDYAVPERHLLTAATELILHPVKSKKLPWWEKIVTNQYIRPQIAKLMIKKVSARASRAHYPAPYAVIDLWQNYMNDRDRMLQEEAASIAHLIVGKKAKNLIRIFKLQETLKGLAADKVHPIEHIHVIGGGVMGGDIATWCALQGFHVTLQDQQHETLARVIQRAAKLYQRRFKIPRLVHAALDRLTPDIHGDGLVNADVVIEAIFEDEKVKRDLFKQIEPKIKKTAIIATNTSSIPLENLSSALDKPQRLIGLHFFNPVAKMPLVEIVIGKDTSKTTRNVAIAVAKKISRLPLPVTSTPGFLVNRILMPYLTEAVKLAEEGVPLRVIDDAALEFGMPMGPIELADTVGLDICLKVAEILSQSMPITVPENLRQMVENKQLGKKTGKGFYLFKKGKPVKPQPPKEYQAPTDLQDRLILRLLNETMSCLRENVTESVDLIDAGIVFGTGFAPFRGGPLNYVKTRGQEQILMALNGLEKIHGARFKPDEAWSTIEIGNE